MKLHLPLSPVSYTHLDVYKRQDIGRLLQGFSAEGSNTVDLGAELGEGFSVLGLDTGQYRIEGSVLTIEDGAISSVTWVSAGEGGELEETVKNAFTLALGCLLYTSRCV